MTEQALRSGHLDSAPEPGRARASGLLHRQEMHSSTRTSDGKGDNSSHPRPCCREVRRRSAPPVVPRRTCRAAAGPRSEPRPARAGERNCGAATATAVIFPLETATRRTRPIPSPKCSAEQRTVRGPGTSRPVRSVGKGEAAGALYSVRRRQETTTARATAPGRTPPPARRCPAPRPARKHSALAASDTSNLGSHGRDRPPPEDGRRGQTADGQVRLAGPHLVQDRPAPGRRQPVELLGRKEETVPRPAPAMAFTQGGNLSCPLPRWRASATVRAG